MSIHPHPLPEQCELDPDGRSAWHFILQAQSWAEENCTAKTAKHNDRLINIRVLGFLLKDLWDHHEQHTHFVTGYNSLLREVERSLTTESPIGTKEEFSNQCENLCMLGCWYRVHLFRVFWSNAGPTPSNSEHPSRPSFEATKAQLMADMASTPKTKHEAKDKALIRDGYQCRISRAFDSLVMTDSAVQKRSHDAGIHRHTSTTGVYLFSESAQDGDKPVEYAGNAFSILTMFGLGDIAERLMGVGVNNLSNVITMSTGLHTLFDVFKFWLEEVPNRAS
ncbi:hypothetical protein HGRIS_006591 [Hohenbuehelia grisea]|uniref:HNH nuclease domain-containing protein n=1 Tax=Hohenbuehelia grisea TaxID=104357 RepID=A0ABR3J9Z6_9AGAR